MMWEELLEVYIPRSYYADHTTITKIKRSVGIYSVNPRFQREGSFQIYQDGLDMHEVLCQHLSFSFALNQTAELFD